MAQRKKQQGKAAFLRENYLEAIALLTEASGADPLDADIFALRSAAYAALAQQQVGLHSLPGVRLVTWVSDWLHTGVSDWLHSGCHRLVF
jgi:hypothetical protein